MILIDDPSSAIAAALAGWDYPISREALLIADLYDLTVATNSDPKKGSPKPHPGRPFEQDRSVKEKHGDAAGRTRDEVISALRATSPPV